MSKVQKNREKENPVLYNYYGKQYNFNDLRQQSDLGFNDYIQTLKRGNKDYEELWNAYSNIMSGIQDGSITFDNGRFVDSKGRYSNGTYYDQDGTKQTTRRKSKDYYGLVANYIQQNLGKSQEYQSPEDKSKIKWNGNSSLGLVFNRKLFNSDKGNIMDFIDLDEQNPDTKSRGLNNRLSQTKSTLEYLQNNFDKLFTGYSDEDYNQAQDNLKNALQAISDNKIQSGDYLQLSRALGDMNWRTMFLTQQKESKPIQEQELTPTQKFEQWINSKYPVLSNNLAKRSLSPHLTYSDTDTSTLQTSLQSLPEKTLYGMVRSLLADKNYTFNNEPFISKAFQGNPTTFENAYGLYNILYTLKNKNLLMPFGDQNPNLYYIPNTYQTNTNTGWVWDTSNNTIQQMNIRDIPYWQQKLINEYKSQNSNGLDWATPYLQKGGILKAQSGESFNNIYAGGENPDIGYTTYLNKIFLQPAVLQQMKNLYNGDLDSYSNAVKNNVNSRFTSGVNNYNNNLKYTGSDLVRQFNTNYQNKGNTFNYTLFGNSQDDYNTRQNGALYSLTNFVRPNKALNTGDSWNSDPNKAYIDNALGLQTYSRVMSLTDPNIKDFGDWGDYWRNNGATGAYYYTADGDTSGKGQWIPTTQMEIQGFRPFSQPYDQKVNNTNVTKENNSIPSKVLPIKPRTLEDSKLKKFLQAYTPDIIGLGRLTSSIVTNNRVASIIDKALNPVLKDTYERYSPIIGNLPERHFRNRQAQDLRNMSSTPFTSDASLQLARQLESNRQANDLEYQGFLADNKMIQQTRQEALARQEDNMARKSEVANFNRASINQTEREKAELEATRLRRNWQSVDNFAQGLEQRLRAKLQEDKNRRDQFRLQTAMDDTESQYQDAISGANASVRQWETNNYGKPLSNMPGYSTYINFLQDMQKWRRAQQFKTHADIYGYTYNNKWVGKTPEQIKLQYGYRKQGGVLSPNVMYLIKKIIKNESNT